MLVNKGEGIYTLMGMVSGMNRLVGSIGFLFAAFFFVWLGIPAGQAMAAHCFPFTIAGPVSGLLFENYETHEYVDHLLILHLKLKTPDNVNVATFRTSVDLLSDTCGGTVSGGPLSRVITTPGSGLYSIRFTSSTHFDIWNDEINTKLVCESCSQDIPERPGYHEFVFKGITEDGLNQFYSTSYRIRDDAPDPPVLTETLPTPPGCVTPAPIGLGFFFDDYERTEYVGGLLRYHFRLKTPLNDGRGWRDRVVFFDASCHDVDAFAPLFGPTNTPHSRYFSIRFTSPTHFDVWNDETNAMESCLGCSIDIPATMSGGQPYSYVSFRGDAGSGASILTSTPFPVSQPLDPVIIVPGILESWLHNGEWELDPILHTFDNLWDALEAAGYEEGRTLFFLGYDFRQSNVQTAHELREKIVAVKAICGCTKVDLIAHSMGGLVSRQYIQSDEYADDVDQMIFLGTPHLGSPKAYLAWEGGELTTKQNVLSDMVIQRLFEGAAHKNGFSNVFEYISSGSIPSVQELLPIYDYIIEETSGAIRSYPSLYPQNLFLENLNAPENLGRLLGRGVRFTNVVGSLDDDSTVGGYVTIPSVTLPKWEHGYPNDFYSTFGFRGMFFEQGDKTVPFRSAGGLNGIENLVIPFDHQKLISKSQENIIHEITGSNPNQTFNKEYSGIKALFIQIFSPISITVTDPEGRTTGADINNIPGAFYTGPGEEQFLVILDPLDGGYQVSAVGTGSGAYEIVTNFLSDTQEASTTVTGTALPDIVLDYILNINTSAETPIETVPVDSTAPVTVVSVVGTSGENGWYVSPVVVTLSADDGAGVGVVRTEYSLDGGVTWQLYTTSIPIDSEGSYELLYRSKDFVDNRENDNVLRVRVDTSHPEARIQFDPGHHILRVEGMDMSSTTVSKSGKVFIVSDEAGHETTLNFSKLATGRSSISGTLVSMQYGDGSPIVFSSPYAIGYSWSFSRGGNYKRVTQKISRGKKLLISTAYNSNTNKTVVRLDDGTKEELPGLILIKLETNKGSLSISY